MQIVFFFEDKKIFWVSCDMALIFVAAPENRYKNAIRVIECKTETVGPFTEGGNELSGFYTTSKMWAPQGWPWG